MNDRGVGIIANSSVWPLQDQSSQEVRTFLVYIRLPYSQLFLSPSYNNFFFVLSPTVRGPVEMHLYQAADIFRQLTRLCIYHEDDDDGNLHLRALGINLSFIHRFAVI